MGLIIYLNELSCSAVGPGIGAIRLLVEQAISALREAVRIRDDTTLRLPMPVSGMVFGAGNITLAQLFPGRNNIFSVLRRCVDRAPFCPVTDLDKEVVINGQVGVGLTWAFYDRSFVLSMGHAVPWSGINIVGVANSIDELGALVTSEVEIRNVATVAHVGIWRVAICDYGRDEASSSIVYRGGQFVIRMFPIDHDPPHVHVYAHAADTSNLLAKVRIDNGDVMRGYILPAIRSDVFRVIVDKRERLMESWVRCRAGRLPLELE